MDYEMTKFFSASILISALIGIFKARRVDTQYLPFIVLLCAGCVSEMIGYYLVDVKKGSNAVSYNLYCFAEATLLLWQFYRWKVVRQRTATVVAVLFTLWWEMENLVVSSVTEMNSTFIIGYSILVIYWSILLIVNMLFNESYRIWRNPKFIISCCLLVYFIVTTMIELFWFFHINEIAVFKKNIYEIQVFLNLLVNLLFIPAVIWMPRKLRYTMPW